VAEYAALGFVREDWRFRIALHQRVVRPVIAVGVGEEDGLHPPAALLHCRQHLSAARWHVDDDRLLRGVVADDVGVVVERAKRAKVEHAQAAVFVHFHRGRHDSMTLTVISESILEGEKVRLRPMEPRDLPHFVEWLADPEVRRWLAALQEPPTLQE